MKIIIGSRGSKLAIAQSQLVIDKLKEIAPEHEYEIKVISTKGDQIQHLPLDKIGDKGLFVREIEDQIRNDLVTIGVHSMKDMPSTIDDGLEFTGTITSEDNRDCLILNHGYQSIDDLPNGAVIGSGSKRRAYQLNRIRPDIKVVNIRGNVNTRLEKMKEQNMDGIILAAAGLKRLGMENIISYYFPYDQMVPACAQGCLALQIKEGSFIKELIDQIVDPISTQQMTLERSFLMNVEGSCHIPVGSSCRIHDDKVDFYGLLGDEQGHQILQVHQTFSLEEASRKIKEIALEMKGKVQNNE